MEVIRQLQSVWEAGRINKLNVIFTGNVSIFTNMEYKYIIANKIQKGLFVLVLSYCISSDQKEWMNFG